MEYYSLPQTNLKVFCGFLSGVIIGFIFSPVKHGVNVRVCNNGNHDRGEG